MNIDSLIEIKPNPRIPKIEPGDRVKVGVKVVEGGKERVQVFDGVVIRIKRGGAGASFTVRRVVYGIGVERTFPFNSPMVEKVTVVRHGKVRRSKLYYLRGLSVKAARLKERRLSKEEQEQERQEAQRIEDDLKKKPSEVSDEVEEEKLQVAEQQIEPESKQEEPLEEKAELEQEESPKLEQTQEEASEQEQKQE